MTTDLITKDQLINAVLAYKDSDNVNPTDTWGSCQYEDDKGNHCLIGQALVDLGVGLTAEWIEENPGAVDLGVWADEETAELAESLQMNADGINQQAQPWKVAIERALNAEAKYNG